MARNDPVFGRVDISLLHDPRIRTLKSPAFKWFYLTCYLSAVEARCETLPAYFTLPALADRAQIDVRTAKAAVQKCCEAALLQTTPDGLIFVPNVRINHGKLEWRASPQPTHAGRITSQDPTSQDTTQHHPRSQDPRGEERRAPGGQDSVAAWLAPPNPSPDPRRMIELQKKVLSIYGWERYLQRPDRIQLAQEIAEKTGCRVKAVYAILSWFAHAGGVNDCPSRLTRILADPACQIPQQARDEADAVFKDGAQ